MLPAAQGIGRTALVVLIIAFMSADGSSFQAATPKAGRWEGLRKNRDNTSTSFEVDGTSILNLKITIPFTASDCVITTDRLAVKTDGAIQLVTHFESNENKKYENSINGRFESSSTFKGKYSLEFCPDPKAGWVLFSDVGPLKGEWAADLKK